MLRRTRRHKPVWSAERRVTSTLNLRSRKGAWERGFPARDELDTLVRDNCNPHENIGGCHRCGECDQEVHERNEQTVEKGPAALLLRRRRFRTRSAFPDSPASVERTMRGSRDRESECLSAQGDSKQRAFFRAVRPLQNLIWWRCRTRAQLFRSCFYHGRSTKGGSLVSHRLQYGVYSCHCTTSSS